MMCDASGVALGVVLGQCKNKIFHLVYYTRKTLNFAQKNYTFTEQELLVVVYVFAKFRAYLYGPEVIFHTNHIALRYFMAKKEAKLTVTRWVLLHKEFDFEMKDRKGCENQVVDHLFCLESSVTFAGENEIEESFTEELVMMLSHDSTPWHADYANYVVCGILPDGLSDN